MCEKAQQPNETIEPLDDVQGHIMEMENLFEEATVNGIIKNLADGAQQAHLDYDTAICRPRCVTN